MPDDLFRFFLLRCPCAKSNMSAACAKDALNLADNGWNGPKLHQLMQWVALRFIGDDKELHLRFVLTGRINDIQEVHGLIADKSMPNRQFAYLSINNKLSIDEHGKFHMQLTETYATCLFRHIRNSLAHGNFHVLEDGNVALFDYGSKPNTAKEDQRCTFAMLTSVIFLRDLMNTVTTSASKKDIVLPNDKATIANKYRIKIDKKVQVDDGNDNLK